MNPLLPAPSPVSPANGLCAFTMATKHAATTTNIKIFIMVQCKFVKQIHR